MKKRKLCPGAMKEGLLGEGRFELTFEMLILDGSRVREEPGVLVWDTKGQHYVRKIQDVLMRQAIWLPLEK